MAKNTQKQHTSKQDKSTSKLNNLFPLPNPSSTDIQKTFEEMGKTIVTEMGDNNKPSETPTENAKNK